MGTEMEAEIVKCIGGKLSDPCVSKAIESIDRLSDSEACFARVQLALLGIKDTRGHGHPQKALRVTREHYRNAIKTIKHIECLRPDENIDVVWKILPVAIDTNSRHIPSRERIPNPEALDKELDRLVKFSAASRSARSKRRSSNKKPSGKKYNATLQG